MELINRIRKSRKGFTLVEIIVVLVILAIIAAFTIPSMMGFIKDANDKAHLAEARTAYIAAQSVATEMVGTGKGGVANADAIAAIQDKTGRMLTLIGSDVPGTITGVEIGADGNVTKLIYTVDSKVYTYTSGVLAIS
jgi:prepilin-type N-terminal cleavage/methylation domain